MDIREELRKFYEEDYSEDIMEETPVEEVPSVEEDSVPEEPEEDSYEEDIVDETDTYTKELSDADLLNSTNRNFAYLNMMSPKERRSQLKIMFSDDVTTPEGEMKIIRKAQDGDKDAQDYLYMRLIPKVIQVMIDKFGISFIVHESMSLAYDVYGLCRKLLNSDRVYSYLNADIEKGQKKHFISQFIKRFGQTLRNDLDVYANENYLDFSRSEYYDISKGYSNKALTQTDIEASTDSEENDRPSSMDSAFRSESFEDGYVNKIILQKLSDTLRKTNKVRNLWFADYMDYKLQGLADKKIAEIMGISTAAVSKKKNSVLEKIRAEFSDIVRA